MRLPNGSQCMVITAMSAGGFAAAGSTGPSNFAGFESMMYIVSAACVAGGTTGTTVSVQRSATSNGTFAGFGASIAAITAGSRTTHVQNVALDSSATWYLFAYDNNNGGSANITTIAIVGDSRYVPVPTQDTHTTVQSDRIGG